MVSGAAKVVLLVIMILNGVFFVVNISVVGDREAAMAMHRDLAPSAGTVMVNAKVFVTFAAGVLYLLTAFGIIRKKRSFLLCGVAACLLFNGLYGVELAKWGGFHPWVWKGFLIAGGLSFLIGAYSCLLWRRSRMA